MADCHRVINHRELEHLCNVALVRGERCDVLLTKNHFTFRRRQQAGDDVQQRGFPAARRTKKRVGPSISPRDVDLFQRVIIWSRWIGQIAMTEMGKLDFSHLCDPRSVCAEVSAMRWVHKECVVLANFVGMDA